MSSGPSFVDSLPQPLKSVVDDAITRVKTRPQVSHVYGRRRAGAQLSLLLVILCIESQLICDVSPCCCSERLDSGWWYLVGDVPLLPCDHQKQGSTHTELRDDHLRCSADGCVRDC